MYLNEGCLGVGWSFDGSYLGDPCLGEMGREAPEVMVRDPREASGTTATAGGKGRAVGETAAGLDSGQRLQDSLLGSGGCCSSAGPCFRSSCGLTRVQVEGWCWACWE